MNLLRAAKSALFDVRLASAMMKSNTESLIHPGDAMTMARREGEEYGTCRRKEVYRLW